MAQDSRQPESGGWYKIKFDAFQACGNYLSKLGRRDGDIFERRYFYVGSRHGVRIYEPYNIQTNAQETNIHQCLIWQEHRNMNFIATRRSFEFMLADHYDYIEAIA